MPDTRAAAFEHVFRENHGALVAFCFRRVDDHELARDLTAETFRIAWSRWNEPRRSDRAWLFGVARNLIGNEYSRRRTHPSVPLLTDDAGEPRDDHSDLAFTAVDVQAALATLSPIEQEVLKLTYWDDLTAAEAALVLHTTPAAIWVRLSRARQAFSRAWHGQTANSTSVPTRTTR